MHEEPILVASALDVSKSTAVIAFGEVLNARKCWASGVYSHYGNTRGFCSEEQ